MAVSAIFWTTEVRSARLSSRETKHVQVFIRRPSLGLDQGNQQHLMSTTFGNPSEVRHLPGGPQHALMPRASWARPSRSSLRTFSPASFAANSDLNSAAGQNRECSGRAQDFRFVPKTRHLRVTEYGAKLKLEVMRKARSLPVASDSHTENPVSGGI